MTYTLSTPCPPPLRMPCTPLLISGIVDWDIPTKLHYHLYFKNFVSLALVRLMILPSVMPVNAENMFASPLVLLLRLVLFLLSYSMDIPYP